MAIISGATSTHGNVNCAQLEVAELGRQDDRKTIQYGRRRVEEPHAFSHLWRRRGVAGIPRS